MQAEYGDSVRFIGVASRDDAGAIEGFVEKYNVGQFDHIIDTDGVLWSKYGVMSQPAFTFINDDGTVDTRLGALGSDGLTEAVESLQAT